MNFYRTMSAKARFFILLFCLITIQTNAFAQNNTKITIKKNNISVIEALQEIEKQSKMSIAYNESQLKNQKNIQLDISGDSVENALSQALVGTGFTYQIKDGYVMIIPAKPTETPKRKITGTVVDEKNEPLIGVNVIAEEAGVGAATDIDGKFSLSVDNDTKLTFSYIGYVSQTISTAGKTTLSVILKEDGEILGEVVVTALGIKRSEKALSYNVQQVKAEDITAVKDVNFVNSLSGKVAGLNINSSSSGIGGASKVVMRGTKSIEQSSNALYVIDGVPMYNFGSGGATGAFNSAGSSEGIADLNPEDIESISVLSGAAAAALYGSDAANGAIMITTKKGKIGKINVTVTSNTEILQPFLLPQFQNTYGTSEVYKSWGTKLNDANFMGYNPRKDYFKTGVVGTESVALSVGNDKNQTYLSASAVNSKGIIPNNKYNRYNLTFRNTTSFLDDKMKLDLGVSYIMQNDRNMINQGTYHNPLVGAYLFPRGNDWKDIQMYERWDKDRSIYTQYWPSGEAGLLMQNPYWVNYRNVRENKRDRYMINAGLSYQILDWLGISSRFKMDNSNNTATDKRYASTALLLAEKSPNGYYGINRSIDKQTYADFLVNINKNFDNSVTLAINGGVSTTDIHSDLLGTNGPILYGAQTGYDKDGNPVYENPGVPNLFNVFQLSDAQTLRVQEGWRERTNSIFASAEVGYKSTYYLTLTGRNDWASQLAGPNSSNKSFFYPSVGASVVLSEIINLPKAFSYLKVRGSWASVGLPFKRFLANPTYKWNAENKTWSLSTNYPMYNLKPERTNSWEFGLNARVAGFNLDLTYYRANTANQTFNPNISASSGWSNIYIQTGNVLNEGMEFSLGYSQTWNKFMWASNYTFSFNKNTIIDLADNATNPITGESFSLDHLDLGGYGPKFILKKGGTLGDIYSTTDMIRDDRGAIYVDEKGNIAKDEIREFNKYIKLGSVFPKSNMAWRNDFSLGGLHFGFMLSARFGGVVYSGTQAGLDYFGVSKASAIARDNGGILINGQDHIDAQKWYSTIGVGSGIPQYYTYDATNVRLQEASIGYTFPRKWFNNIFDASISVVGRNLWMIYCKAPFDPESVASTNNYYQGIDNFMTPSTRNIGVNVRLNF
ncbi:MAG: SusC/RagA family TonB-linked outer membrane protein [Bacteroidia bacterium]|nr:SusC/RagA family TonB-linked outer membrane protein [Bacteroidia bacterium]